MLHTVARTLIAFLFLGSGITKIIGFEGTVSMMAQMNLPLPSLGLLVAISVEVVGAGLLLSGYRVREVTLVLIAFLIPTTLIFHVPHVFDPGQWHTQLIQVLKNVAIMGGLLQLFLNARWGHRERPEAGEIATVA